MKVLYSPNFRLDGTDAKYNPGRCINHAGPTDSKNNLRAKAILLNGEKPTLVFVATNDILPGSELFYDYGDRRKCAIKNFEFLRNTKQTHGTLNS
jgi:SET domain-containing protein